MSHLDLLEKHKPVLVIYPQEFHQRARPGSRSPGPDGWADYHPCSVEFFLGQVSLREQLRPWEFSKMLRPWLAKLGRWTGEEETGIETIRQRVTESEESQPGSTHSWELDVAKIPSQDDRRAWESYRQLVQSLPFPFETAVYGRCFQGPSVILQYWYLYLYNDFKNNHEGDWEMVTVQLKDDSSPDLIGVSAHSGGLRREWGDTAVQKDGDRPVVYVARGSHAGYFRHLPRGVKARRLIPRMNFPKPFRFLERVVHRLHLLRRKVFVVRDYLPADPTLDAGARQVDFGQRISPTLTVIPSDNEAAVSERWWLRFRGTWGSSHSRFIGTMGPTGPWAVGSQDKRWHDPVDWLANIDADEQN